jgi:hypothetical protein
MGVFIRLRNVNVVGTANVNWSVQAFPTDAEFSEYDECRTCSSTALQGETGALWAGRASLALVRSNTAALVIQECDDAECSDVPDTAKRPLTLPTYLLHIRW